MTRTELINYLYTIEIQEEISHSAYKEIESKLDEIETIINLEKNKSEEDDCWDYQDEDWRDYQ